MVTSLSSSPESIAKAYTRIVSNFADNAVSAIKACKQHYILKLGFMEISIATSKRKFKTHIQKSVNTAKTFEQNTREVTAAARDVKNSSNVNASTNNTTTDFNTTTKKQ